MSSAEYGGGSAGADADVFREWSAPLKNDRLATAGATKPEVRDTIRINASAEDRERSASRSVSPPFLTSLSWSRHRPAASDASSISSRLSLATSSITSSISPPPSSTLSPTYTDSSYEQHGFTLSNPWASTPKSGGLGHASTTSSLASPITLNSVLDDHVTPGHILLEADTAMAPFPGPSTPRSIDLAHPEGCDPHHQLPLRELISVPFRPKRRNRESWDSALGSDMNGLRTRGSSLAGLEHHPFPALGQHGMLPPPTRDASRLSISSSPGSVVHINSTPVASGRRPSAIHAENLQVPPWEHCDETSSETTVPAEDAAGRILNYTLDVAFGVGAYNVDTSMCRSVVHNFISDLGWAVDQSQQHKNAEYVQEEPASPCNADNAADAEDDAAADDDGQQPSRTRSNASDQPVRAGIGRGRNKRKSHGSGGDDPDRDDSVEDGDAKQSEPGPSKKAKLDAGVRMSCPYRKKNPLRFNVRDHRLCALTVFTDTAELRRHIQDCHRRPVHSPHRCPRCQVQFFSADSLREHLLFRDGVLCTVVESGVVFEGAGLHDPEDGIDNSTAERLRSKKGRVADTIEVQWQKIWELLFPDTEVQPYEYCAVMEHHELYAKLRENLTSFIRSIPINLGEPGFESLDQFLTNHIIELFEQCNEEGRRKDYRNRQPKGPAAVAVATAAAPISTLSQTKNAVGADAQLRKQPSLRKRLAAAHRDSGYVDDDQSIAGGLQDTAGGGGGSSSESAPGISTPAFTSDDGSSPGLTFRNVQQQPKAAAAAALASHNHQRQFDMAGVMDDVTGFPPSINEQSMVPGLGGVTGDLLPLDSTMTHFADAGYGHLLNGEAPDYPLAEHYGHGGFGFPMYGEANAAAVAGMGFPARDLSDPHQEDSTSAWVYNQRL